MSIWYILSVSGICLSIWGVIQLGVMGNAYATESVMLMNDVEPKTSDYKDFDEYLLVCEANYRMAAKNCFVAAYIYFWILIASVVSMLAARFYGLWKIRKDDQFFCGGLTKLEKKKIHTN